MAGYAVHRGYQDPWWAGAIAASCGFLGDLFFFWLWRRHGSAVLARWPSWARSSARVEALLARYGAVLVILVRFAYGLRMAGPVLIGTTNFPAKLFAALNALGAVIWTLVIGGLGWAFGETAQRLLGEVRHLEGWLLLGLLALAGLLWGWSRFRRQH